MSCRADDSGGLTHEADADDKNVRAKGPYSPPVLKLYGSVSNLTTGSQSGAGETNNTRRKSGSDRNIKQDVVRIGTHQLGIGLYLFNFQPEYQSEFGSGRHLGVMADEVETVLPEAVSIHPRGFKTVDYDMLKITLTG